MVEHLQQQAGREFAALAARVGRHDPADLAFSVVSLHEQMLGCHTYISRARSSSGVVRGYRNLARLLRDFAAAPVLPFDAAAAAKVDELATRRPRIGNDRSSERCDRSKFDEGNDRRN
jgi:tRNA(fMet)-specific endonuclease VapC